MRGEKGKTNGMGSRTKSEERWKKNVCEGQEEGGMVLEGRAGFLRLGGRPNRGDSDRRTTGMGGLARLDGLKTSSRRVQLLEISVDERNMKLTAAVAGV